MKKAISLFAFLATIGLGALPASAKGNPIRQTIDDSAPTSSNQPQGTPNTGGGDPRRNQPDNTGFRPLQKLEPEGGAWSKIVNRCKNQGRCNWTVMLK